MYLVCADGFDEVQLETPECGVWALHWAASADMTTDHDVTVQLSRSPIHPSLRQFLRKSAVIWLSVSFWSICTEQQRLETVDLEQIFCRRACDTAWRHCFRAEQCKFKLPRNSQSSTHCYWRLEEKCWHRVLITVAGIQQSSCLRFLSM